jgi:hypothetical protein
MLVDCANVRFKKQGLTAASHSNRRSSQARRALAAPVSAAHASRIDAGVCELAQLADDLSLRCWRQVDECLSLPSPLTLARTPRGHSRPSAAPPVGRARVRSSQHRNHKRSISIASRSPEPAASTRQARRDVRWCEGGVEERRAGWRCRRCGARSTCRCCRRHTRDGTRTRAAESPATAPPPQPPQPAPARVDRL